jgi:nucleoside-diphosphate-sugar epimerase
MKILIIGGTGFLGRHLAESLLRGNQEVSLLNRGFTREKLPFQKDVQWLICDRHDADKFRELLKNSSFDIVIDTCAYVPEEVELVFEVFRDRISKYIFCSSMAVAINRELEARLSLPIKNRRLFPTSSKNSYAYNKSLIEEYLVDQFDKNGFPFISLRPAEINGPGEAREWYYIERIKNGRQKILIPGNGECLVQPGYIDDIIQAFLLAIVKDKAIGECYNVTGDEIISLNDYIRLIAETMGRKVKIINIPHEIFKDLVPTKYVFPYCYKYSFVVDTTKIKTELGYQPEVNISDGLRRVIEHWSDSYSKRKSPYNPSGEFEFISYDLEDLFLSVWEKVMDDSKEQVRSELLEKGMLI